MVNFVVSAERQPRGIIEIDTTKTPHKIKAFKYDKTKAIVPEGRDIDFVGLFSENNVLYTLHRSAGVVCKLIYNGQDFEEKDLWSFKAIVERDKWRYSDMKFGKAEGLCMDSDRVYVILDNNGDSRYLNPNDKRPLLLIMERPVKGE